MTTIEKLRATVPIMKEWGQFAAVELCEQAAAELEALQRKLKAAEDAYECACGSEKLRQQELLILRTAADSLRAQLADVRQHSAQSDKELCQLQDALGCPCESRKYFCDCGWRGYNQHKCPKCGKETHDDGMADAQELCMERIRDFVMYEDENKNLRAQNQTLRNCVEYVAGLQNLFFAECSQAEEIVQRCKQAVAQSQEGKS